MLAENPKLSAAQRRRLDVLSNIPSDREPKVIRWDDDNGGPVLRFPVGTVYTLTRDGGFFEAA